MEEKIRNIVTRAIDFHVHIGPEIIPRKYTAASLVQAEKGKLAGAVLKNHFYATSPFVEEVDSRALQLYGGLVLNWPVGGINPEAVRAATCLNKEPITVWLPTIHAANFLDNSEYEIAPEWLGSADIAARKANQIEGIRLTDNTGQVIPRVRETLAAIKDCKAVLATGHISAKETQAVVDEALHLGQKAIVITHPIYQRIGMDELQQKEMAAKGCFIEQCYSMYSIDKIPIEQIAGQIKSIGPEAVLLSSDVGQMFSVSPSEALIDFASRLVRQDIPLQWIETMMVTNPKRLLELAKEQ